ncbi:serine/arginine-rich splicing factor 11-like isoform X5 [Acipenser ruthenus]|uniref:serine/arginine-rich splicing factor 11-like isoform X5 n=1 Tax=Acipenser ruthenus TaxID=7906 RepID=UPI00145B829E|nr:serine/arginine-rich splicing factor 11-like isoform X5 [Acipenser ruthenus]XP_058887841.1 serine/arginine-rich splicing factor 11-like isoform X5 [Acipenser ruthenus]XP_058887842.1 serine/arginine-rich splicing factor 11-like isoform X5 [Acipenser ruthenus]XP_058887843.1 serine/arginine-rich splicing factor 11-like isoform X5 [Acipenser ruthenus]XP_058887844.1 serine/arginine-rich splicing factor 11-like isoform X5 [Acipenser ruthenus]
MTKKSSTGVIPDEAKALSLLAPANAVAGLLPGGGLLPTPNPMASIGGVPLSALGGPTLDQGLAAYGLQGAGLNSQSLAADQLLKLMSSVDPKLNHVTAGLVNPAMKSDASSKEIEEAMKRVREAQSLISAAIEPGNKKDDKRKHSRSRSRSRRRRSRSRSRHRRSKSRSRRRSQSKSRSRRRSKSPRRRRSHSRDRSRRSRSKSRDRKKEEKEKKRSKTPPKSYSTTRRSRSPSRDRRRRRSRSVTRSPPKKSPKRKMSKSPSPRRHKKEKKKDKERERDRGREREKDRDRSRDERERSTSKKKKSKDKEKERERKSDGEKGDVKRSKLGLLQAQMAKGEQNEVTRDYDEEEQGYDSEKDKKEDKGSDSASPKAKESSVDKGMGDTVRESKVNGDDHHEEDMDMSD